MEVTDTAALPQTWLTPQRRAGLATLASHAGLVALSVAVILSPFRARLFVSERPLPPVFTDYTDLLFFWNQLFIVIALACWGAALLLQPRRIDFAPMLIRLPVAGIAVALCISVPMAEDRELALFNTVTLLGFVAFALYVVNNVRSVSQVLPAIAVMIAIQAVVAVAQVVDQAPFGLTDLGELNLDPAAPGVSILWTDDAPRLLRGYGMSDHPNILGGVLAAGLLLVAAGIARARNEVLVLLCGVFAIGVAGLFVTFSRSGALGLFAGLGVLFALLAVRREWTAMRLALAACLLAALVTLPLLKTYSPYLEARVNPTAQVAGSPEGRSLSEREALARNTNHIFVDNPLTGVGAGVLPTAMREAFPDFGYNYAPAHVAILVVAAETGIFGAAAYGALMLTPWILLWLRRHQLTPELIGVSSAFLALQVIGLLDYYTWSLDSGRLWFWLVLGLWVVAYRNATGRHADA